MKIRSSYNSKHQQQKDFKELFLELKNSKKMMKKALDEIDALLETEDNGNLNDPEYFYRSSKFIGGSLKISSIKVPNFESKPGFLTKQLEDFKEVNGKKKIKFPQGNPLFTYYSPMVPKGKKNFKNQMNQKQIEHISTKKSMIICQIK